MRYRVTKFLLKMLVRLGCTYRYEYINKEFKENILKFSPHKHYIYAIWHQNILAAAYMAKDSSHILMVSPSRDGDIVCDVLGSYRYVFARGSSSREGKDAMLQMIHTMNTDKIPAGIAVDGPRGPFKIPKHGIFKVAQKTAVPIIPLCIYPKKFWELNSWDRFRLPMPFTTITVFYGTPIYVDRDMEGSYFSVLSEKLKDTLEKLEQKFS